MPGSRTSPGSIHQTPVAHRLSREAISSSPLSPFTYRWPTDEVREVVEKAQFLELVRHSGWLLKQHGNGPHPSWSRRWFYLLDDRLCYTDEPGKVEDVRYIPLDRIPVRALPRGYGPQIGVTVIEDRQVDKTELPPQSSKRRACVFSVQCGTHTHFMAAVTAAEAELWVERITQTWVHCSKFTGRSIRARNLADSFVHTQQHLLQENTALRQSIEELTKQQTSRQLDMSERSQSTATVAGGEVPEPIRTPRTTKLSQNAGFHSTQGLPHQASVTDLQGPTPCDSPSARPLRPQPEEKEWPRVSMELVTYELELDTGSCKGAGTNAHVLLELFGGEGMTPGHGSGVHCLEQGPYQPVPFGPGQTDAFEIRSEQLDELVMVRVSHDDSDHNPAWFLEEIRARQKGTEKWYHFYCGRWLAKEDDDGAISRDVYRGERPMGVQYHLAFKTSDIRGAGTSANVFLIMHGHQASGAKHHLAATPHDFDRDCSDEFTVEEGADLGDLTHVTVGHDSAGKSPSWHLEALVITHEPSGRQWSFGCDLWFDPQQGDGLTQRDLFPISGKEDLAWYTLLLCTSDRPGAGTDADVFVTIHGAEGSSPRVKLPSRPEDFLRGNEDTFRMQLKALGEIAKLTVGHNNRGHNPSWHVDHAELTNEAAGVTYYFACQRWFSRDEDDGLIERDLFPGRHTADNADMHYMAEVFTSDVRGAGTDADVSLELFGHLGRSGLQTLHGKEAYARAAVAVFQFACQGVGEMQMLRISHNNAGPNPDWHLEKVIITEKETGSSAVFLCNEWLSIDRADGAISRDLQPFTGSTDAPTPEEPDEVLMAGAPTPEEEPDEVTMSDYTVWVHTSNDRRAGTDGRVAIELHGQGGSSGLQWLHPQQDAPFSRGKVSQFTMHLSHVGQLERLTLATDAAPWLCDLLVVHDSHLQETVYFLCGRWLGKEGTMETMLEGSKTDPRPPLHNYKVTVITSDIRNAGTDADIFIDIKGELACSGRQQLVTINAECFTRGSSDDFELSLRHMGPLHELHICHNGTAPIADWHLAFIIVADTTTGDRWYFSCSDWLSKAQGTSRALPAQVEDPRQPSSLVHYKLVTYTSDLRGAGTDATVFVELTGKLDSSPRHSLIAPGSASDSFGRGQTDTFTLQLPELGVLQSLTIGHDNKGHKPGWHLDRVEVTHLPTGRLYHFPCLRWLDTQQDDAKIARTLQAQDEMPSKAPTQDSLTEYEVTIHTADTQGAGTDADVSLVIYGTSGESKPLPLKASVSAFCPASVDTFPVRAPMLGELTHIRLSHDAKGPNPDWLVEMVHIVRVRSQQEWLFFGHVWLHSGNGNQVILAPGSLTQYSVTVHTSDMQQAMSRADGFAILHGASNSSSKVLLTQQSDDSFQAGSHDTWSTRDMQDLGPLQKLTIGLKEQGPATAWHIRLVEVTNLRSKACWRFPCNRWLAAQRGNGATQKELYPIGHASCLQPHMLNYQVAFESTAAAAEDTGLPTPVWLQMHGSEGVTPPLQFEPTPEGGVAVYERNAEACGELSQLTVWLEPTATSHGPWHLQSIEVLEKPSGRLYYFPCPHWLDRASSDRVKLSLGQKPAKFTPAPRAALVEEEEEEDWQALVPAPAEAPSEAPAETASAGIGGSYTVVVHTSDLPGAGTGGGVWLDLQGLAGSSGPQDLPSSSLAFERAQAERFPVHTPSHLGPLTELTLGFRASFPGDRWHPHRVEVTDEGTGLLYIFFCQEWLGDDNQNSMKLKIGGDSLDFDASNALEPPQFHLAATTTAAPYATATAQQQDSTAQQQDSTAQQQDLAQYIVTVYTSDLAGAGTDCSAYISIHGKHGDTGKQGMTVDTGAFARGSVKTALVEGQNVGQMLSICVGHNDQGIEAAWHLDKVKVHNSATNETVIFKCRAWLDATSGDGRFERMFYPLLDCSYKVELQTSDLLGAGTSANGVISLIGKLAEAGPIQLVNNGSSFQRGSLDVMTLDELPDVGPIQQVEVGHDGEGPRSAWHLAWVRITNLDTGVTATFECNRWLKQTQQVEEAPIISFMRSAAAEPQERFESQPVPQTALVEHAQGPEEVEEQGQGGYKLTFTTSSMCFAGTNAQVFFELIGSLGSTGVIVPAATGKTFQKGAVDTFTYPQLPYVGEPFRLRVFTDGAGFFPGWHLKNVDMLHLATNIRYVFDCCDWLNKKCKNERVLIKPWVQPPPVQAQDWRVTEVYPAQLTAGSPFKARSRSISPSRRMISPASPTRHASPYRGTSMRSQQQQLHQTANVRDGMPSLQQKLQADFDRYRRIGQQTMTATGRENISPTQRQKPLAYRSLQGNSQLPQQQGVARGHNKPHGTQYPVQVDDASNEVSGRRLQPAASMDRRRRLVHQRTADVVPRLDSMGYGAPVKQMLPSARGTQGRTGQPGRASAPPWTGGGQSGRRLSPARFAEREQEPLLPPGLAHTQRIGAMH